jgi:hypothetical protein
MEKCSGCRINDETGDDMLNCKSFGENDSELPYDCGIIVIL